MPAFEIHVLRPSSTRSPPSRRAWFASPTRRCRRRLGERERRDRLAGRDTRQIALLQLVASELRDRTGAQALHAEGEVGHPGQLTERLASEADRPDVEAGRARGRTARAPTYCSHPPAPSRRTISRNVPSTSSGSCGHERRDSIGRPRPKLERELAMRVREERPREVAERGRRARHARAHATRP